MEKEFNKYILIEKYIEEMNEEEMKILVNKKLADIIIEVENNPILYLEKSEI